MTTDTSTGSSLEASAHYLRQARLAVGLILTLAISLGVAACGVAPGGEPLADGGRYPLEGRGKWLVINYWAEWCGPCRHEIPELNGLNASTEAPAVDVLGVNYDGLQLPKLQEVSTRMGIEFPVLIADPRARWEQPLPTVLPSTLLIAPTGELVDTLVGPQTAASIRGRIAQFAAD